MMKYKDALQKKSKKAYLWLLQYDSYYWFGIGLFLCLLSILLTSMYMITATGIPVVWKLIFFLSTGIGCAAFLAIKLPMAIKTLCLSLSLLYTNLALYLFLAYFHLIALPIAQGIICLFFIGTYTIAWRYNLRLFAGLITIGYAITPWMMLKYAGLALQAPLLATYILCLALTATITDMSKRISQQLTWPELSLISLSAIAYYFSLYLSYNRLGLINFLILVCVRLFFVIWQGSNIKDLFQYSQYTIPSLLKYILILLPIYWISYGWPATIRPVSLLGIFLYALVIYLIGLFWKLLDIRLIGYGIYLYAYIFMLWLSYRYLTYPTWTLSLHMLYISAVITMAVGLMLSYKNRHVFRKHEYTLVFNSSLLLLIIAFYCWCIATIILFFDQLPKVKPSFLASFFEYQPVQQHLVRTDITQALICLFSIIYASALYYLGKRQNITVLQITASAFMMIAFYKFGIVLVSDVRMKIKIITCLLFGTDLIMMGYLIKRVKDR